MKLMSILSFIYVLTVSSAFGNASYKILYKSSDFILRLNNSATLSFTETGTSEFISNLKDYFENDLGRFVPKEITSKLEDYNLIINIEKNASVHGLFYPGVEYPSSPYENRENELHLSFDPTFLSSPFFLRFFSHELFHAIHYVLNPGEEVWIREGLAQLFEMKMYNSTNSDNLLTALSYSTTSLFGSFDIFNVNKEQYGHSLLYFYYLNSKCASNDDLFWDLTKSKAMGGKRLQGVEAINFVLSQKRDVSQANHNICKNFKASADHFMIARVMNKYSGFDQDGSFFIMESAVRMNTDDNALRALKKLSTDNLRVFFTNLPSYLPLVFKSQMAKGVFSKLYSSFYRENGVQFVLTAPHFPYEVLSISDISELDALIEDREAYNLTLFKSLPSVTRE